MYALTKMAVIPVSFFGGSFLSKRLLRSWTLKPSDTAQLRACPCRVNWILRSNAHAHTGRKSDRPSNLSPTPANRTGATETGFIRSTLNVQMWKTPTSASSVRLLL